MLAGLFLFVDASIYLMITGGRLLDIARGAPAPEWDVALDFTCATVLLVATKRFLSTVASFKWQISGEST